MTIKQVLKIIYEFMKDMGVIIAPAITLVSFVFLYNPWQEILNPYFEKITFYTIIIAFIFAIIKKVYSKYRNSIKIQFKNPDVEIKVKYGNLIDEKDNLVIGINNFFDTHIGDEIILPSSIQGQFEEKYYKNNVPQLDKEINKCLKKKNIEPSGNIRKKIGKNSGYPIGTTVTIKNNNRYVFLCAYSNMNEYCKAESNIEYLTISLNKLWEEIKNNGQCLPLSMGVIGSGLARINVSNETLLYLLLAHFMSSSKNEIITSKLTIVLHKKDRNKYNLSKIEEFLKENNKG